MRFTVVGEALVDLVETAPGRLAARPGGSPLNVAVTLARLGAPVALVARTGRDAFGRAVRGQAAGVDLAHCDWADEPTSLAVATLDERGQARYDFYLDATAALAWSPSSFDDLDLAGGVLHVGSIASWRAPSADPIGRLQRRCHEGGDVLISYDPNVRPALLDDVSAARALIEASVAAAHVIKASEEDVAWLYPGLAHDEVAARWLGLGALLVVVTLGADGAIGFSAAGPVLRAVAPAVAVVDTVGAGDSFAGALLAGLADAGLAAPDRLAAALEADPGALAGALDLAATVSALTCTRRGADPPTRDEVRAYRAVDEPVRSPVENHELGG